MPCRPLLGQSSRHSHDALRPRGPLTNPRAALAQNQDFPISLCFSTVSTLKEGGRGFSWLSDQDDRWKISPPPVSFLQLKSYWFIRRRGAGLGLKSRLPIKIKIEGCRPNGFPESRVMGTKSANKFNSLEQTGYPYRTQSGRPFEIWRNPVSNG